jgi:hypothetical protein
MYSKAFDNDSGGEITAYSCQRHPQPAPSCGLSESEGRSLASELVRFIGEFFILLGI